MKSRITHIDHKHYFHVNGDIGNKLVQQLLCVCAQIIAIAIYPWYIRICLCAKYGIVQSMGCPTQSSDHYFAKQTIDLLPVVIIHGLFSQ